MARADGIWSGGGGVCSVFESRKKKRETEWEREEDGEVLAWVRRRRRRGPTAARMGLPGGGAQRDPGVGCRARRAASPPSQGVGEIRHRRRNSLSPSKLRPIPPAYSPVHTPPPFLTHLFKPSCLESTPSTLPCSARRRQGSSR